MKKLPSTNTNVFIIMHMTTGENVMVAFQTLLLLNRKLYWLRQKHLKLLQDR
jgi:hypothetical protein